MSDEDHKRLVDTLLNIKGKAMLSGYANPIYVPLEEAGWKRHDFAAVCSTAVKFEGADLKRVESVWVRA
jgi:DNA adenine methylase